jgi:hypothetical protein
MNKQVDQPTNPYGRARALPVCILLRSVNRSIHDPIAIIPDFAEGVLWQSSAWWELLTVPY